MGYLIDSDIIINAERGKISLEEHTEGKAQVPFYLSIISASELLHGVFRAKNDETRNRRSVFVESIVSQFPIINLDITVARIHAQIWAEVANAGYTIGAHDLWIAATALANNLTLATCNVKDFKKIPGLRLEHWC